MEDRSTHGLSVSSNNLWMIRMHCTLDRISHRVQCIRMLLGGHRARRVRHVHRVLRVRRDRPVRLRDRLSLALVDKSQQSVCCWPQVFAGDFVCCCWRSLELTSTVAVVEAAPRPHPRQQQKLSVSTPPPLPHGGDGPAPALIPTGGCCARLRQAVVSCRSFYEKKKQY